MKRIIAIIGTLTAVMLVFACLLITSGCGKTEATKEAEKLINSIGDVDLNSIDALESAKEAYAKLGTEEKEKVGNYKKLEKAIETYNEVKSVNDDIAAIVKSSETSFSDADFKVSDNLAKISDVKSRYDDLKKYQQETIKDYDKLDAAEKTLTGYVENAKKAAVQYVKAFLQTEKGKDATVTGVYCIKQIRNKTDEYHFMALAYKGADGKEHNVYSCARFTQDVSVDAIKSHEDTFFADDPVNDSGNAEKSGNVTLNAEEIVAAAKQ